jgi:hypothetical protein
VAAVAAVGRLVERVARVEAVRAKRVRTVYRLPGLQILAAEVAVGLMVAQLLVPQAVLVLSLFARSLLVVLRV